MAAAAAVATARSAVVVAVQAVADEVDNLVFTACCQQSQIVASIMSAYTDRHVQLLDSADWLRIKYWFSH